MAKSKRPKRRDAWLTITLSQAEKATVTRRAERYGMTNSSYARMRILFPERLAKLGAIESIEDEANATAGS